MSDSERSERVDGHILRLILGPNELVPGVAEVRDLNEFLAAH